jgi:hypothetical protein
MFFFVHDNGGKKAKAKNTAKSHQRQHNNFSQVSHLEPMDRVERPLLQMAVEF